MRLATVAPLYALSGLVALGCETLWFRALGLLFGSSLPASGAVLGAFMAGLCVGGYLGSRLVDRIASPVRLYAAAEGCVALCALAIPRLCAALTPHMAGASTPSRLLLSLALLGPATVSMGVTLPALAAAVIRDRSALERELSALYTLNLGGAVAGPLLAAFGLLPRLGLRSSSDVFALVAAGVSVAALRASPRGGDAVTVEGVGRRGDAASPAPPAEPLALALLALLGVVTFALQVTWNRALAWQLGASAWTFALITSTVVAALGAGSAYASGHPSPAPRAQWWARATRWLLGFAVSSALGVVLLHVAPFFLAWGVTHGRGAGPLRFALVLAVVGPPSFHAGALFPLLAARVPAETPGEAAGRAAVASTMGNAAGALLAAFVAVPRYGVQSTLAASSALAAALACVAASGGGWERFRGTTVAVLFGAMVASGLWPRWDVASASAGTFRAAAYRARWGQTDSGCTARRRFTERRVLFHRDGALGSVLVLGHPAGPRCSLYALRVDGKAEGSALVAAPLADAIPRGATLLPEGDLPTEVLAGWLPAALVPAGHRAFLVGWGTGLSARALLDARPSRVTAVEIEPAVFEAGRLFDRDAVDDPRVLRVVDDARNALRREPEGSLDVVASHPSNPWVVGASSLFTSEYFSLARSRLRPGGAMLAWVQLYETDREAVRALVATFVEVFPAAHAFRPSREGSDLLLLGVRDPAPATREALSRALAPRCASPESAPVLERAGIAGCSGLLDRHLGDGDDLRRWTAGAERHTEDRPVAEFRIARRMLAGDGDTPDGALAGLRGR